TTSRLTSSAPRGDVSQLAKLIESLPGPRADQVYTHASWATERSESYERLEFLGDSVLELAIARELYDRYPDFSEGRLAKVRSHVVSRASCAVVARQLALGERLTERGAEIPEDELHRLAHNRNVLAALLEAALAALFLEHGFERIERPVVDAFSGRIEYALTSHVDYKTELQEALARRGQSVSYSVLEVEGPPHDRRFRCAAVIEGEQLGVGSGASKKAAEQEAAKETLAALGVETPAA
ncbi:MAG TPA: ribonuclease III, partial [Gaiellaceae bacterium]|nr:ribonuclease III [Gaiellaceae bacterium]